MALISGDKLGPYEIIAPIGAGGMGEVYRAHDPRLGRDVDDGHPRLASGVEEITPGLVTALPIIPIDTSYHHPTP